MPTRRRRTASETGCEESAIDGRAASILLAESNSQPLNILTFNPQQVTLNLDQNNYSLGDAIYKKTDGHSTLPYYRYDSLQSQNINLKTDFKNNNKNLQFHPTLEVDENKCQTIFSNKIFSSVGDNCSVINQLWNNDLIESENMASRDRTQEFARIIRSQQGSLANGSIRYRESKKPKDFRQYGEFMQRAKLIGKNISSTYAKLEKLTHLAKKRSLFDDSQDQEIQELTGIIRHDLTSLTKQLEDIQNRSKLTGATINGSSGHLQKHSANLVGSLQTKVASITQKFRDILEVRTENLKKQAERREQYAGGMVSGELPPQAVAGHHQGSVLLADEAAASATRNRPQGKSGDFSIDMGNENPEGRNAGLEGAVGGTIYQQQLQLMEEQDAYLQSRADTMKTIESTIVELGQMFTQLATMVKEQEEIVHRIDSNVDEAEMNVEAAHTELLKYFKSVSSNRWLMLKIFGVLIFFFVIFVVFMA